MTASAYLDACGFTAASSGTGNFVVSLAIQGYQTPANAGAVNSATYSYRAESADKSQWEEGYGPYTVSSTTLARATITANSNGNTSPVNFTAAPNVFVTALSADLQNASLLTSGAVAGKLIAALMRSYLAGLTLSTAGSSSSFQMLSGVATDSTNSDVIVASTAITKTTAAWAQFTNNGGLDTGTIAANTWYHVYIIKNPTTGAFDCLFSLSPTAPSMPTGFTLFRRIGSMKTNGSSQWILFNQNGDEFLWGAVVSEIQGVAGPTTPTLLSLAGVPSGLEVWARFRIAATGTATMIVQSPDEGSAIANATPGNSDLAPTSSTAEFSNIIVRTNTSAQVRWSASATGLSGYIATFGWIDRRGKDA